MTRAITLVNDALGLLRITDPNEAPEPEDASTAIRALNMMMESWEIQGLSLGWRNIGGPQDEMNLPKWAEECVTYNLAIRLRPHYGVPLEPDIVSMADVLRSAVTTKIESGKLCRLTYEDYPDGV